MEAWYKTKPSSLRGETREYNQEKEKLPKVSLTTVVAAGGRNWKLAYVNKSCLLYQTRISLRSFQLDRFKIHSHRIYSSPPESQHSGYWLRTVSAQFIISLKWSGYIMTHDWLLAVSAQFITRFTFLKVKAGRLGRGFFPSLVLSSPAQPARELELSPKVRNKIIVHVRAAATPCDFLFGYRRQCGSAFLF